MKLTGKCKKDVDLQISLKLSKKSLTYFPVWWVEKTYIHIMSGAPKIIVLLSQEQVYTMIIHFIHSME